MKNKRPAASATLYSPRATLCAIGIRLRSLKLFDTIADHVKVKQKTIKHTPAEKLTDAFIAILAGAHGLREINTRVRSDAALQRAFGRSSCAEQSVVQETLDACDAENVRQMKRAFKALTRAHSRTYRHPYKAKLQLLDVDMTGLPCGRRAEKASKGYFANKPHRYGRQMARVCATHYEEVVLDWVGPGNVQLNRVLRPLVEETEWMLDLDAGRRARTVWLLKRGYQIHSKDVAAERAAGKAPSNVPVLSDASPESRLVVTVSRQTCRLVLLLSSDSHPFSVARALVGSSNAAPACLFRWQTSTVALLFFPS